MFVHYLDEYIRNSSKLVFGNFDTKPFQNYTTCIVVDIVGVVVAPYHTPNIGPSVTVFVWRDLWAVCTDDGCEGAGDWGLCDACQSVASIYEPRHILVLTNIRTASTNML